MSAKLKKLDTAAHAYAASERALEETTIKARERMLAAAVGFGEKIKELATKLASDEKALDKAIKSAPELFDDPRTMVLHGIKFGFKKGAEKMEFEDEAGVIALIKKHLPDQVQQLVLQKETVSLNALKRLTDAQLRKLACERVAGTDEVIIKRQDGVVDKLVDAVMKGFS